MYRSQFWTMSQYAGYGSAEDTNKWYKYLLKQGQKGNSVAFDLPTQLGYDSDHQMALGEVGKVGVAVDTLADMEILFDGISIGEIRQSMTINASASIILAMYIAIAENRDR
jgi:methylmalonyl-CoA mutase N-terminal domain/subunit